MISVLIENLQRNQTSVIGGFRSVDQLLYVALLHNVI